MKPVVVSDILAVGEFPTADQLAILAKAGFKAIINNQPDGEVERFQDAAAVAAEAAQHGLAFAHAPLSSRTPPADELARYGEAVARLPSPIYAFCYSGARSAAGCALLLMTSRPVDAVVRDFAEAGFDLEALRPWLQEERARHVGADAERAEARKTAELPPPIAPPQAASAPSRAPAGAAYSGNGNGHANDAAAADKAPPAAEKPVENAPAAVAVIAERKVEGLPRMVVVVQPRAAAYGGFAV